MLSNKTYDILKWISLLAIPTVTFITSVSDALGFPYGAQAAAVVSALGIYAGAVIKISTDRYNNQSEDDNSRKE